MTDALIAASSSRQSRSLWRAFVAQSMASVATTLLSVGIFFYTQHYYGWEMKQNFLLAASQGLVYVVGSLSAARIVSWCGSRRRALTAIYLLLAAVALIGFFAPSPQALVVVLLAYTLVASSNWPIVESIVTSDADAHEMSRRIGVYNLTWSLTNAAAFAASGSIIEHWRAGMFIVPAVGHALSAILLLGMKPPPGAAHSSDPDTTPSHSHAEPEPELLAKRTLALWLARIALPATYVVIYSLMAMMPSLPVMKSLRPAWATPVGSIWMLARFAVFIVLGATVWWHTRPHVLLASAVLMGISFVGVTLRPTDLFGSSVPYLFDLGSMIAWQLLLGVALAMIYAGSLYFGMVLSAGSTEHGGYHEALIGLGSIVGPGSAALTQAHSNDPRSAVFAVSAVIALSIALSVVASIRAGAVKG